MISRDEIFKKANKRIALRTVCIGEVAGLAILPNGVE
jgi:hypothetical protein